MCPAWDCVARLKEALEDALEIKIGKRFAEIPPAN
jgi:hypothetical protein